MIQKVDGTCFDVTSSLDLCQETGGQSTHAAVCFLSFTSESLVWDSCEFFVVLQMVISVGFV